MKMNLFILNKKSISHKTTRTKEKGGFNKKDQNSFKPLVKRGIKTYHTTIMMEKNSALNKEDKSRRMSKTNPEKELDASMEKHSSMSTAGY